MFILGLPLIYCPLLDMLWTESPVQWAGLELSPSQPRNQTKESKESKCQDKEAAAARLHKIILNIL